MIGGQTTANSMPGSVLGSGAGQAGGRGDHRRDRLQAVRTESADGA